MTRIPRLSVDVTAITSRMMMMMMMMMSYLTIAALLAGLAAVQGRATPVTPRPSSASPSSTSPCPSGQYHNGVGCTDRQLCGKGREQNLSAPIGGSHDTQCVDCVTGWYKADWGNSVRCQPCLFQDLDCDEKPNFRECSLTGDGQCYAYCDHKYYFDGTICLDCTKASECPSGILKSHCSDRSNAVCKDVQPTPLPQIPSVSTPRENDSSAPSTKHRPGVAQTAPDSTGVASVLESQTASHDTEVIQRTAPGDSTATAEGHRSVDDVNDLFIIIVPAICGGLLLLALGLGLLCYWKCRESREEYYGTNELSDKLPPSSSATGGKVHITDFKSPSPSLLETSSTSSSRNSSAHGTPLSISRADSLASVEELDPGVASDNFHRDAVRNTILDGGRDNRQDTLRVNSVVEDEFPVKLSATIRDFEEKYGDPLVVNISVQEGGPTGGVTHIHPMSHLSLGNYYEKGEHSGTRDERQQTSTQEREGPANQFSQEVGGSGDS